MASGLFSLAVLVACTGIAAACTNITLSASATTGVIITSPNFPRDYDWDLDECWSVETDSSYISIEIRDFDTEPFYDYLKIYDGNSTDDSTLGGMSGRFLRPKSYNSSGQNMFISFKSDGNIQRGGFQACLCNSNPLCTCDDLWIDPQDQHEDRSDHNKFYRIKDGSLSTGKKVAIGIGVTLVVAVPVTIGLVVTFCCGGKRCFKSKSKGMILTDISTVNDGKQGATKLPVDKEPKHNVKPKNGGEDDTEQKTAWTEPSKPPIYSVFEQPPEYQPTVEPATGYFAKPYKNTQLPPLNNNFMNGDADEKTAKTEPI